MIWLSKSEDVGEEAILIWLMTDAEVAVEVTDVEVVGVDVVVAIRVII